MAFGRTMKISAFGLVLAGAISATAAEYQIDAAHSDVQFRVRHMGISTVTGSFGEFEGNFNLDPANVEATTGQLTIKTTSVNTNNNRRDNHLRSDDFFNAEKFPEIKFKSKEVRNVNMADTTAELVGYLTIRDVTKEIVLQVKGTGILAKDPWGNERAAFSATGRINRFDFDLKWNNLIEGGGGLVVAPEVDIILSFQGVRPAPGT